MSTEQEAGHPAPAVALEDRIAELVGHARQKHGHSKLQVQPGLRAAARDRAHTMLHDNSLSKHPAPLQFILHHFHAHHAGEAAVWGSGTQGTAEELVHSLLNDAEERGILFNGRFTHIGVGAAVGTFQGYAHSHVIAIELADG